MSPQFPVELVVKILEIACDWLEVGEGRVSPTRPFAEPNDRLVGLTHVCGQWRAAALGTPSLWTHIDMTRPSSAEAQAFLARSKDSPLAVGFGGFAAGTNPSGIFAALRQCMYRVYYLRVVLNGEGGGNEFVQQMTMTAPLLETVDLDVRAWMQHGDPEAEPFRTLFSGGLPNLKRAIISPQFLACPALVAAPLTHLFVVDRNTDMMLRYIGLQGQELVAALSDMPSLKVLHIYDVLCWWEGGPDSRQNLARLDALEELHIRMKNSHAPILLHVLTAHNVLSPLRLTFDVLPDFFPLPTGLKALMRGWRAFEGMTSLMVDITDEICLMGRSIDNPSAEVNLFIDPKKPRASQDSQLDKIISQATEMYSLSAIQTVYWENPAAEHGAVKLNLHPRKGLFNRLPALRTFAYVGSMIEEICVALTPSQGDVCPALTILRLKAISPDLGDAGGWSDGALRALVECVNQRRVRRAPLQELRVDFAEEASALSKDQLGALTEAVEALIFNDDGYGETERERAWSAQTLETRRQRRSAPWNSLRIF